MCKNIYTSACQDKWIRKLEFVASNQLLSLKYGPHGHCQTDLNYSEFRKLTLKLRKSAKYF